MPARDHLPQTGENVTSTEGLGYQSSWDWTKVPNSISEYFQMSGPD